MNHRFGPRNPALQLSVCALALSALACAGTPMSPHVGMNAGDGEAPPEPIATKKEEPPPPPPDDVVEQAAAPFFGVRTSDGKKLDENVLLAELARADAVCVGERHDQPSDHFAELAVLRALLERREIGGFEVGVGLEMFERDKGQGPLDSFAAGRIDLDKLVELSDFQSTWGFPIQYYAPILETARANKSPLIALNVSRKVTRAIAESGVEGLPEGLQRYVPEMKLDDVQHRALFDGLMAGHPDTGGSTEKMYEAQVLWDEVMAERASNYLASHAPARKLVVFAGRAHCFGPAIPDRMKRRGVTKVVSVLPMVEGEAPAARAVPGGAEPAARAPSPEAADRAETTLVAGYDYKLVMTKK